MAQARAHAKQGSRLTGGVVWGKALGGVEERKVGVYVSLQALCLSAKKCTREGGFSHQPLGQNRAKLVPKVSEQKAPSERAGHHRIEHRSARDQPKVRSAEIRKSVNKPMDLWAIVNFYSQKKISSGWIFYGIICCGELLTWTSYLEWISLPGARFRNFATVGYSYL